MVIRINYVPKILFDNQIMLQNSKFEEKETFGKNLKEKNFL